MLGGVLRGLGIIALLAVSLAALAWLGQQSDLLGLALVLWASGCLLGLRSKKTKRYQHGLLLGLGIVAIGAAGLAIDWIVAHYASMAAWINVQLGAALTLAGLAVPPTAAGAVTFLNGVGLVAWAVVKFLLLGILGRQSAEAGFAEALAAVAYRQREQVWRLKPWWVWARSIGWLLLLLGVGLVTWQAWNLREPAFAGWVRLLPVLTIAVGIEWLQWLSGVPDAEAEPEFVSGAPGADQLKAVFEDLWVRYRQVWPKHWRAAGNRPPEFPSDG